MKKKRIEDTYPKIKGRVKTMAELEANALGGYRFEEAHIDNMDILLSRIKIPIKTILRKIILNCLKKKRIPK